jgi:hypothetical protein
MRLRLALTLVLLAARSQPDIDVTLRGGRVVVRAVGAPLADILTRFGQATGAQIVYEAPRPRQLVTVVIEADSPAAAVAQLLEGQGLNYVLRLDPVGKGVEMLVIAGSGNATPTSAGAARNPRASPPAFRPPEEEDQSEPGEVEAPLVPEAAESAEPSTPPGTPGQGPPSPETPPGSAVPEPGRPQPPAPASYPGSAPVNPPAPQPPVFPEPASYPPGG